MTMNAPTARLAAAQPAAGNQRYLQGGCGFGRSRLENVCETMRFRFCRRDRTDNVNERP